MNSINIKSVEQKVAKNKKEYLLIDTDQGKMAVWDKKVGELIHLGEAEGMWETKGDFTTLTAFQSKQAPMAPTSVRNTIPTSHPIFVPQVDIRQGSPNVATGPSYEDRKNASIVAQSACNASFELAKTHAPSDQQGLKEFIQWANDLYYTLYTENKAR